MYTHLKKLGFKNIFFTKLLIYYFIAIAVAVVTFCFKHSIVQIFICLLFATFTLFYHFVQNLDIYILKDTYKKENLSPQDALKKYQVELCCIHSENSKNSIVFIVTFIVTLIFYWFHLINIVLAILLAGLCVYEYLLFLEKTKDDENQKS